MISTSELSLIISRDAVIFFKSFLVGFAVSIPFGPASILALRRTLQRGFIMGLIAALGIVVADTFWGALTGYGLTSLAESILELLLKLRHIGGAALILCGVFLFLRHPATSVKSHDADNLWHAWLATFGITLANPFIPVLFAAAFASVGLDEFVSSVWLLCWMIGGILSGALLWWCFLCAMITLLHRQLKADAYLWINKLSGLLLIAFGFYALLTHASK